MNRPALLFPLLLMGSALVVACGGNTNTTPVGPTSSPSGAPSANVSVSASPSATPTGVTGTFPLTIVNNNPAITPSSAINLYIYGQQNGTLAFEGVNANGSTYVLSSGSSVKPIAWSGGSANTETVYLPALIGARVYIVDGTLSSPIFTVAGPTGTGPSAPAPWSLDASKNVYFDNVEYAETTAGNVNFDVSQTDAIGLDLEVSAASTGSGTETIGLKPGAITAFANALGALGSPWSTLANEMPYHVINPQHGTPNFFPSPTFLDNAIMTAWDTYQNGNWMEITAASLSATNYPGPLYGTVDASGNFDFYSAQSTASTLIGTIGNPQTYAANHSSNLQATVTNQMFAQDGVFDDFTTPSTAYPSLGPAVGNRLSGALNSGVMAPTVAPAPGAPLTVQPVCTGRFPGPTVAPYENQFAAALHSIANTYAYVAGAAYGYPYDDLCGTSTDTTATGITQMTITINP